MSLPYSLLEPLEREGAGGVEVGSHGVVLGAHGRLAALEGAVDADLDGRQMADHDEYGHDGEKVAGGDGLLGLGDDGLAVGDHEVDGVAHDDLEDGALVLVRHYAHHQNLHKYVDGFVLNF